MFPLRSQAAAVVKLKRPATNATCATMSSFAKHLIYPLRIMFTVDT